MLFKLVSLTLSSAVLGDEVCSDKLVKDEAVMMMQKVRRGEAALTTAKQVGDEKSNSWNDDAREASIQRLMQSSTQLLKAGVTPDVATFATSTIKTIEDEAVPAILEEHSTSVELVKSHFANFGKIQQEMNLAIEAVDKLEKEEAYGKGTHTTCRADQQDLCDISTTCNTTLAELWEDVVSNETKMNISNSEIGTTWCYDTIEDPLDRTFYQDNVVRFDKYIQRKKVTEVAWDKYNTKFPDCETKAENFYSKKATCEKKQESLETASCARASAVKMSNLRLLGEWAEAVKLYEQTVNTTQQMVSDRKLEFQGISTVKCLLDNIHANAASGEPCDEESHPDKIHSQIDSCHTKEVNTTHLTIEPEPTPPTPPAIELKPYPCGSDYSKFIGYDELPSCASAKACEKRGCVDALDTQ